MITLAACFRWVGDRCFSNREAAECKGLGFLGGHLPSPEPQLLLWGVGTIITPTLESKIMLGLDENTYEAQPRAQYIVDAQ